ncbi:SPOR domain-containing protein [Oceanospirillum sediminis]|uniref:SPOR domain-containing protein n=1 Tax=Oceanospirillum sediminis TaxID=2760088 RepID=A0A839ITH3_9GAMM|nr:SPOR domain-containing protein [Oceanospirillum sediminis]MBB1487980.1 SPOR domain-containing protein [Oceanospirillum sediminis]
MSRDFANKSSANRASASPKPKAPDPQEVAQRKELPAWSWLIFGVVLGFGLARFLDEDKPVPEIPPAPVTEQAPLPAPAVSEQNSDSEERKRFDFYNLLPQQEVTMEEVPEYKSTPRDAENLPSYMLQVGSFKSRADAERFSEGLKRKKYSPVIAESSNGWHRVRIGPFKGRRELNKAQNDMSRSGIQSLLIRLPQ